MKILKTVIAAVAVFAMTIGSGFAMDNNPPTEPVKAVVETEVVEEVQPLLMGYGYKDATGTCIFHDVLPPPTDCSVMNSGPQCTIEIEVDNEIKVFNLFLVVRTSTNDPWVCTIPLREP